MNNYYVYMYSGQDGNPFYIGKGKGYRYLLSRHLNDDHPFLNRKILKVGIDNIQIKFLYKDLTEEQAFYLEEYYIAGLGRKNLGLGPLTNCTNGGEGGSGQIVSSITKQKMSKAQMGNKHSLGYRHSDIAKEKISSAHLGKIVSKMTRIKMSKAQKGKIISEEQKRKISIVNKGNKYTLGRACSAQTKVKISLANKGKKYCLGFKHSEESRKRMSIARKTYWENKKNG